MICIRRFGMTGSAVFLAGLVIVGCTLNPTDSGNLVPETADENPNLPQVQITLNGTRRTIHLREFGDAANPLLFILPGSISDVRAYLPLQVLADKYHVVMWDLLGNGLSERVGRKDLSADAVAEQIHLMKELFSPENPMTLIGHSWSAVFAAYYAGGYPGELTQLVLIEPPGLKDSFMEDVGQSLNLFTEGYLDMMYSRTYLTGRDHESLDYAMLATLKSGVRDFFCDENPMPDWPIWRAGGFALIVWESAILNHGAYDYDFTEGLEALTTPVLLVGSSCSPIGYTFQEKYNAGIFPNASVLRIENSGHRIITEQFEALLSGLHDYLEEYK